MQRVLKHLNPTYLRNRAMYLLSEYPPLDDSYGGGEDTTPPLDQRPLPKRWDVTNFEGTVSCPNEEGLFLHRKFIDGEDLKNIERFIAAASKKHKWFTYHTGRDMMPVNSIQRPQDEKHARKLRNLLLSLQSANNTDPRTWPYLEEWGKISHDNTIHTDVDTNKDNNMDGSIDDAVIKGALVLSSVQKRIQCGEILPKAIDEPCLFIQIQNVIRGGVVGSHIDPLVKGGKCITTLIVNGVTDVRVGNTVLKVEPGDLYGIEGNARYNIEHEVYATVDDRLTATLRFGYDDEQK
jgi:hypothetical protein